ncbi:MAG TPA: hypothetical protein V6D43_19965 [Candidatus Sericytochromatia bacterium]
MLAQLGGTRLGIHEETRGRGEGETRGWRYGGGLNPPPIESHQITDFGGGLSPWALCARTLRLGHIPLRVPVSPRLRVILLSQTRSRPRASRNGTKIYAKTTTQTKSALPAITFPPPSTFFSISCSPII